MAPSQGGGRCTIRHAGPGASDVTHQDGERGRAGGGVGEWEGRARAWGGKSACSSTRRGGRGGPQRPEGWRPQASGHPPPPKPRTAVHAPAHPPPYRGSGGPRHTRGRPTPAGGTPMEWIQRGGGAGEGKSAATPPPPRHQKAAATKQAAGAPPAGARHAITTHPPTHPPPQSARRHRALSPPPVPLSPPLSLPTPLSPPPLQLSPWGRSRQQGGEGRGGGGGWGFRTRRAADEGGVGEGRGCVGGGVAEGRLSQKERGRVAKGKAAAAHPGYPTTTSATVLPERVGQRRVCGVTAATPRPSLPCGAAGPKQEDRGERGAVTQVGLRRGGRGIKGKKGGGKGRRVGGWTAPAVRTGP